MFWRRGREDSRVLASDGIVPLPPPPPISLLPLLRMLITFELVSFSVPINNTIIPVGQLGGTSVHRNYDDIFWLIHRPMKRDETE